MPRFLAVLAATSLLTACSPPAVLLTRQAPATFSQEPGGYEQATVQRVVDGDTIDVAVTARTQGPGAGLTQVGHTYRVRLLGIDTPETVKPDTPVQCYGHQASAATTALLQGKSVRLVKDVEETDQYGRLLRYVYFGDEMANARLVANGYAYVLTYPPNVRHADLFVSLARQARLGGVGLWSPNSCDGKR
ncbi:MAG: micrococcal nuclease [Actinomycetota bacterium]|jgi:micrococcal nuclease|nr:micrococcal nuclease [Actinomycetota bacterium]